MLRLMLWEGQPMRGHDVRDAILRQVQDNPGIHKSALCRALGLSWGSASHHIQAMMRQGALCGVRDGRRTTLFLPGTPDAERQVRTVLRSPATLGILEAIRGQPGIQVSALVASSALSRRVVVRHLGELLRIGLVRAEGQRNRRYYVASQR